MQWQKRAAKDKHFDSLGCYRLLSRFQALTIEDRVKRIPEMQYARDKLLMPIDELDLYDMSW